MIYVIVGLAFAIRAWPRIVCKKVIFSDTYYHLHCARLIRQNRFRIPRTLPRVVHLPGYYYPFLYHLFLAVFPESARRWVERFTGAFFDSLNVLLCYWFSIWALNVLGSQVQQPYLPLLVAALMCFSPAFLRLGSGPRAYNGSPRVFAQTLYLLHIFLAYQAFVTGSGPALVGSLVAGSALIVSANFANQIVAFFGMFFGIAISPLYVLLLLACVVTATLVTRGRALDVLVAQIRHSIFYCRHLQRVFLYRHRRRFRDYWRIVKDACNCIRARAPQKLTAYFPWFFVQETHPVHLLVTVFGQFLVLPLLLFTGVSKEPVLYFMLLWCTAAFCWFVLTKTKPFAFLGEGERYLEYALYPSLFLTVFWLGSSPFGMAFVGAFLIYSIVSAIYFGYTFVVTYSKLDQEFTHIEQVFAELNQMEPGVILPVGPFHYQALYFSRFPVLTYGGFFDARLLPMEEFELVYGNYPHPSERLQEIIDKYRVRYVVSNRLHLDYYCKEICHRDDAVTSCADAIADAGCLVVYRVHPVPAERAA